MKKNNDKKFFIAGLIMMAFSSIITVYAASYLFESEQVSYDNTNSGLTSTNVQDSLDELYNHATDYTSMDTRVSTLEGYFQESPTSVFTHTGLRLGYTASNTLNTYIDFWNGNTVKASMYTGKDCSDGLCISGNSTLHLRGTTVNVGTSSTTVNIGGDNTTVKIKGQDISTKYSNRLSTSGALFYNCYMGTCMFKTHAYNPGNITSRTVIGNIPAGYRPPTETTVQIGDCILGIRSDGDVWMDPGCKNFQNYMNITYPQWQ